MNVNKLSSVQNDRALIESIKSAPARKLTPDELLDQKASFVYGSIKSRSGVTKSDIKRYLQTEFGSETHQAERSHA